MKTRLRQSRRSGVFVVNFEHVSVFLLNLFLMFLLLTLNK